MDPAGVDSPVAGDVRRRRLGFPSSRLVTSSATGPGPAKRSRRIFCAFIAFERALSVFSGKLAAMKTVLLPRIVCIFFMSLAAGVASRAELTTAQAEAFTRDFYSKYKAQGGHQLASFYTLNATFTDPSFGLDLRGRDQIGSVLTKALAKYETLQHLILNQIISGDDLIVEGVMLAKIGGKDVSARFVSIFHLTDGKISDQRDMFDVYHLFLQLGIIPKESR